MKIDEDYENNIKIEYKDEPCRKCIHFDIFSKKLAECYPNASKHLPDWINRLKAYKELKAYFNKNGFPHKQYSGYISDREMAFSEIDTFMKGLRKTFPWLKDCIKDIEATNVGIVLNYDKVILGTAQYGVPVETYEHEQMVKQMRELQTPTKQNIGLKKENNKVISEKTKPYERG